MGGQIKKKFENNHVLKHFFERRDSLYIEEDCLLWGHRVVISSSLTRSILDEIHASHLGIIKMKAIARSFVWWPSVNEDIVELSLSCKQCLVSRKDPQKSTLTPWDWPTVPWSRIHANFLGPFHKRMILVVLDSHSKWPEALIMKNITSAETIKIFEQLFMRYGFPLKIVTDNV